MKKLPLLLIAVLMLTACGEKRICNHNDIEVPCAYYDLFTKLSDIEAQINASFEDDVYLTFEEKYALREQWTTLYNTKKDSVIEAFNLVGEAQKLSFITDMRLQEMDYFNGEKQEREELKKFMPSLDIKAEVVDTSFWGGDPIPTLLWTIKNNSDRTFGSLYIDKNIVVDGKIVRSSGTTFFFSNEQIIPQPEDGEPANVKPGSTVVISFEVPITGEIKPEIGSIGFIEDKE